ncbi:MAG: hypothetical protein JWQ49_5915 [Edaphobacter sp.]|nr:hypothetical protein [Edaphobacter sp.]
MQGEGYLPPLERSGSGTERAAEGRSHKRSKAKRGRLGTLLVARQGRSPSGRVGYVVLRGAQQGALAVVLGEGVVGRNEIVTKLYARAQLIADPTSAVQTKREQTLGKFPQARF